MAGQDIEVTSAGCGGHGAYQCPPGGDERDLHLAYARKSAVDMAAMGLSRGWVQTGARADPGSAQAKTGRRETGRRSGRFAHEASGIAAMKSDSSSRLSRFRSIIQKTTSFRPSSPSALLSVRPKLLTPV
jgi:hypothetical protein